MKTKLTLFILALLCSVGMWAETPASTPTGGKYYYIYAKPTNPAASGAANYYLFYNGSKLTTSAYKIPDFKTYLWKCIDNEDGTFDFQNVSTNTYLGWQAMSGSKFNWQLDGTVTDTKANSLINKNSGHESINYWLVTYCTSSKTQDFDRNSSHGNSSLWTSDYMFEEYTGVIPAETPSAGKKYYLYCQNLTSDKNNDLYQYIYDNNGSFGVATSRQINSAYIWECVSNTNGACVIKNVSTSKYLDYSSGPALSSSSKTVTISNSNLAANAVLIKESSATNYYLIQNTGAPNHANRNYNKYNEAYCGDFVFLPVKTVTFSEAISVNGGSAVSTIYVATDGSSSFTLDANKYYTINETGYYASAAATAIAAAGSSNVSVTVSNLPTYTVTYTCKNLSGYQLASSTQDCAFFVPPTIEGYTLEGVYDDTDAAFDYEKTMITAAKTLKLKYRLTTNPLEDAKSTVAAPTWYTMTWGCGYGQFLMRYYNNKVYHDVTLSYPISDNAMWCFEGNETDGYVIYNKGQSKYLGPSSTDTQDSEKGNYYLDLLPTGSTKWTLIYTNGVYILYSITGSKHLNRSNSRPHYYDSGIAGYGGVYFDNVLTLYHDFYEAAVNTQDYVGSFASDNVSAALTAVGNKEPTTLSDYATFATTVGSRITLAGGYYRIVNADPRFVTAQSKKPAIYYNGTDKLQWTINGLTSAEYQINNIFKLAGSGTLYTIYSPNAQKFIKTSAEHGESKDTGEMGASGATVTFTSLGSLQYNIKVTDDTYAIHCNGHSSGSGTSGKLVQYSGGEDSPSAWYLVKVSSLPISLNNGGDGYYYATMCLPFDVTLASACAYTLTLNGAKNGLTLSDAMSEVPAGTPVLLRHTEGSVKATIASDASTSAPLTTTALTGVYANTTVDGATDYFLGKAGDPATIGFCHWAGSTLNANRAYFEKSNIPGEVKAFYGFVFDDDETGIGGLAPTLFEGDGTAIYNLSGQRLNKMQKGINIVNGKKILF